MKKRNIIHRLILPLLLATLLCLSSCAQLNLPAILESEPFGQWGSAGTTDSLGTGGSADTTDSLGTGDSFDTFASWRPDSASDTTPAPTPADGHVDADNDGLCDDCRVSVIVEIAIFALNDLHGKFADTDTQPGVDELTTYLKNAQLRYDGVVLMSSGDMWQGSSESNLTKGQLLTAWMNELDFVSMTLGNHEYDWGEEYIEANAAMAEFPFLAINVYDRATGQRAEYCKPSVLVERAGLQIGIIGAIGDCYSSISGDMSGDVYFKVGSDLTALVKAEATRLREAGADLIVYSLHDGYGDSRQSGVLTNEQLWSYYDPTLSDGYVDLVFEGHTHQSYVLPDGEGVYHLQNGGENRGISRVIVEYNVANGNHELDSATVVPSSTYDNEEPDPLVNQLMERYEEQVSIGTQVLGNNRYRRSSDDIKNLVARLYYELGEAAWGDDYELVLGGGFLSVRSPYSLPAGEVTYADLQSLLPFDNVLVLCSIKGEDLSRRFVNTDNGNYYNYYGEYGESVKGSILPDATYYVVVDSYTSTYAPNRLTEIARYDADVFARDLVAEYIRAGGWK